MLAFHVWKLSLCIAYLPSRLKIGYNAPLLIGSRWLQWVDLITAEQTMYNYQSEFTQFMNDYLEKNPEVAAGRLTNRAKLWDVTLKDEEQSNFEAADLPKPAYTYQTSADWL